ncbi:helix-turn-helix domain-containing protein [Bacillus pretiosus]|uniref:helix-turn-helix domain-containing protein n=1 Tax=Bacillus pretiosus TaxID=2983392 RepID=UPI003D64BB2F
MTKKKLENQKNNILEIGQIIKKHRLQLSLEKTSRALFIDDRVNKGLLNSEWISEKTLSNIENGYNMPSLPTLKLLSVALEVDFLELIKEIEDFILDNESE